MLTHQNHPQFTLGFTLDVVQSTSLATTELLIFPIVLAFSECHIVGITAFTDCLLSLSSVCVRLLQSLPGMMAHFFLASNNTPLSGCPIYSAVTHLPTEGRPECFQVSSVMSKADVHTSVQVFVQTELSSSLGKHQGMQLLDHKVRVCLVYKKPPNRLPK